MCTTPERKKTWNLLTFVFLVLFGLRFLLLVLLALLALTLRNLRRWSIIHFVSVLLVEILLGVPALAGLWSLWFDSLLGGSISG